MSNQVYTHPGQPQMQVEVILASRWRGGDAPPIYTIRMRYPRPIHGEVMTHRDFSRNARSSRAVPVKTMLNEVRTIPYIPWHWGANQKGMQASEECNELVCLDWFLADGSGNLDTLRPREEAWLAARDQAAGFAQQFMDAGYHKQNANRLLEPFSWMDTLITSTSWSNFLWLRDHEAAEPHLQDLARLVKQAIDEAEVQAIVPGEWHLPYIEAVDYEEASARCGTKFDAWIDFLRKISAARCARISYKPFDGDASYDKELERYESLVKSDRVHASPLEHQATPDTKDLDKRTGELHWAQGHLHGNLNGWVQARKMVPNERHAA